MGRVNDAALTNASGWFLRIALTASYLSAVADRFGFWGAPGSPGVAWGTWDAFVAYVAHLNAFAPPAVFPLLAVAATALEVVIPIGLLVGWRLRLFAFASGLLATLFFTTMVIANGFKGPLDYSVFTVAAASFYLAATSATRRASLG